MLILSVKLTYSTTSNFKSVIDSLKKHNVLKDTSSFIWVSKKKTYDKRIKAGRYLIKNKMNNNDIVNMLRIGNQKPINLTFNNMEYNVISLTVTYGKYPYQCASHAVEKLFAVIDLLTFMPK